MIIFLYGPDAYRRNIKLEELTQEYRRKRGVLDFLRIDLEGESDEWSRVKDFLEQPSLFVNSKLVVVREGGSFTEDREIEKETKNGWRALLGKYAGFERVFVLISDRAAPGKDFDFLLKEPVKTQEFLELEGEFLELFVQKELRKRGLVLEDGALKFFLQYLLSAGARSARAVSEILKIELAGFRQPVSLSDLRKIIFYSDFDEIFPLVLKLLQSRDIRRRLLCLEFLALRGDEPRRTFNLLTSLAKRRDDVLSLGGFDESIKSGELDDETALLSFALQSHRRAG